MPSREKKRICVKIIMCANWQHWFISLASCRCLRQLQPRLAMWWIRQRVHKTAKEELAVHVGLWWGWLARWRIREMEVIAKVVAIVWHLYHVCGGGTRKIAGEGIDCWVLEYLLEQTRVGSCASLVQRFPWFCRSVDDSVNITTRAKEEIQSMDGNQSCNMKSSNHVVISGSLYKVQSRRRYSEYSVITFFNFFWIVVILMDEKYDAFW